MRIYLAGPLFTDAERTWLSALRRRIEDFEAGATVVWPWELFSEGEAQSLGCGASGEIFRRCREALEGCDTVVALLDGPSVDDGTAWEMGYAYARGKRIIGIRTDIRRAGECEGACANAMIEHACERVATSAEELLKVLFGKFR
ncbi:MAG: nucleoside 2-deoxyribosyltransferase [Syntrophobacteraceae bacterium]|nr:nucleoside 2-deoxyribosyltransferase [Desulfobacteraceae bacterium]